ncbi:Retrovirus-related Pol polyprotein from transposon opus [Phytophthora citrophthora]|uniref:RNA-directed DNA polymerase n=1 Tax=Phytophthora citrophthora TaxID=4793 RepID=A0AAD9GMN5_9STRA|nr:Retrovirus-related Pol polyprotein from transposon opus [Phytophthora citrophthora]
MPLRKTQDNNQQCMTTFAQESAIPSGNSGNQLPEISGNADPIPDDTVTFRLRDGECYGWWEDNYPDRSKRDVVMVHGAVNDHRTKILLDTGATINILSYDFARKLGLRLKSHKQTKVSGMGGVPTYIGASAEIKLTLGPRVVYIVDVWVANIGEGIDVLLGMGFMFAAGVRISAREGLVSLPDEVVVMMCNWEPGDHIGRNRSVRPDEAVLLSPGEEFVVRIDYGPTNPQREVVWAGRGDRWVTQLIYAARSWPVAVRVVNISDKNTWVSELSDVARIVEYGFYPRHGRFVRPGSAAYRDWEVLILESTPSPETKRRMEREARLEALMPQPPCVERPDYPWPTEILQRPRLDNARVQFVKSDPPPVKKRVRFALDASTQTDDGCGSEVTDNVDASVDIRDLEKFSESVSHADSGDNPVVSGDSAPDSESEFLEEDFQTSQLPADDFDLMDESWDIPIQGMPGTPVERLRVEYERCMKVSNEELDLEPGVYMREGTELLAQLRDQLVMLPELEELTPECDIDSADVGEPGKTTPEMEKRLRDILKYHRKIFLGDGNAAPAPARGVVCDLDVGDAKPLKPQNSENHEPVSEMPALTSQMTVFQRNIPVPTCMGPVLGRSSYIDDIAHGAPTWDQLCDDLNALLFRLRYWNISVSLPKSEFGKLSIPYLSHEISAEGLRATPKIVKGIEELPFPSTLKGVQSFMGSLNYYNKFIEDLPVIAATLYELTDEQIRAGRDLTRAKEAFEILKRKIVSTPLLRHPDRTKPFVIIPHANPWAASAVLGQEYDGVIHPVRFTGRVLNDAELRYHIAEKEVIAILRVLENFRALVESSPVIVVYTRYSVLKWLLTSNSADGRNVKWGLKLSHWDLEIRRIQRDEDGLPAILGAGITPREHLDEVSENLIPAKGRVKPPVPISVEMLEADYQGYVLSFDGAAKTSTRLGSCGCILWKLPGWSVLEARGFPLKDVTVNDSEYCGLNYGLRMALEHGIQELVVVGDSRIAIQQAQGLINCNQPNLQRRLAEFESLRTKFQTLKLVHVKREFNQAADYLTSKTLALGEAWQVQDADELTHLQLVSRVQEKLMKPCSASDAKVQESEVPDSENHNALPESEGVPGPESAPLPRSARVLIAVTRAQVPNDNNLPEDDDERVPMGPLEFQAERWRRIKAHQNQDPYLVELMKFLKGDVGDLPRPRVRKLARVAEDFVLDSRDVLYRLSRATRERPRDNVDELRLVVPRDLHSDLLHYAHEDYQGGHQGIKRTFEKLSSEFYWLGMYADVERFVKECVDCASGKGRPPNPGPSPGNIEPSRPFEVVSMDFVTHMPKSARGNTFLLLFQDMFSGYVMCKPMSITTAQDVAEAYEERVFRNFGASSLIRHDQDPRFMSEVFKCFRELLGSRQRATLGYRPQANGQQERSVQTVVRAIKAYISEADQSDWDDHAERLMFALNTSFDATRLETPFYLVHGWDAHGTVSAMLGPKPSTTQERTAYEWRRKMQRDYSYALACAEDLQKKAKRDRSEEQTRKWNELSERLKSGFAVGDAVWLYIPKVQTGLSRKLAHMWHGPFRIDEMLDDFRVRLKVEDTGYRVNPWVHVSRLKPRALFPRRPTMELEIPDDDDFDAALLPEDSWEPDTENDEYEVEKILDTRWSKRTRTSRRLREYLVKWKGYDETEWLPLSKLNCGALLYEFNQSARARARFQTMQAGDDHPRV